MEALTALVALFQQVGLGWVGFEMPLPPCCCLPAAISLPAILLLAPGVPPHLPPRRLHRLPQFTFRLLPGQLPLKVETRLTMAPAHGIRVTVHRRR